MSVKDFDEKFGINSSLEEEKIKFINRIEVAIFDVFFQTINETDYSWLFREVCLELGLKSESFKKPFYNSFPNFSKISKGDFHQTLRVLIALFSLSNVENCEFITKQINSSLNKSNIDIGVSWNNGIFYKTGD